MILISLIRNGVWVLFGRICRGKQKGTKMAFRVYNKWEL
jgi:hypothetical protein